MNRDILNIYDKINNNVNNNDALSNPNYGMIYDDMIYDETTYDKINIVDTDTLNKLIKNDHTQTINGVTYTFIGRGRDGSVYMLDGKLIKIFRKIRMINHSKEFFVLGLLEELNFPYIIKMYKFSLSSERPYMIMEKLEGDLKKWYKSEILHSNDIRQISAEEYDDYWLSMLFQITHAIYLLNRLNILHCDMNPGNILYKIADNNHYQEIIVNDVTYNIPIKYMFKIIDFNWVQIVGSRSNVSKDSTIMNYIKTNFDGRSAICRFLEYIEQSLNNHKNVKYHKDPSIKEYISELRDDTNWKEHKILKSATLYGLKLGLLSSGDILKNPRVRRPSDKVIKIMDKIAYYNEDETHKNDNFSLFDMYKIS